MPLVGIGTLPTPFSPASVPLPPETGGKGQLACWWGVGGVPIPTRGIHCGTLYMYVLCARTSKGQGQADTESVQTSRDWFPGLAKAHIQSSVSHVNADSFSDFLFPCQWLSVSWPETFCFLASCFLCSGQYTQQGWSVTSHIHTGTFSVEGRVL
jgi:hypothetical protein